MHVKVGDTVKLITGHENGKIGEITRIFRHNSTVIVKGLNLKTKHMKSREQGEPGQIVKVCSLFSELPFVFMNEQMAGSGFPLLNFTPSIAFSCVEPELSWTTNCF